jgi:hypothetical protein
MGMTGSVSQNTMYSQITPMKPPVNVHPLLTNVARQIAVSKLQRRMCRPNVCIASIPAKNVRQLPDDDNAVVQVL